MTPCNDLEPGCAEQWPDAQIFDYNPSCCRWPKSCSAERCTKPIGHNDEHEDTDLNIGHTWPNESDTDA